jgi:hypothetical protein
MRRFVLGWKVLGHAERLNAHIVNCADDLTILCRGSADAAMTAMHLKHPRDARLNAHRVDQQFR